MRGGIGAAADFLAHPAGRFDDEGVSHPDDCAPKLYERGTGQLPSLWNVIGPVHRRYVRQLADAGIGGVVDAERRQELG